MSPACKFRLHVLLAAAAIALASCGSEPLRDDSVSTPTPDSPEIEEAIEGLGELPSADDSMSFHRRLADELTNVDPDAEGWASETFNEAATAKMSKLAKLLAARENLDRLAVGAFVAGGGDFSCSDLRFAETTNLFESDSIRVGEVKESEMAHRGVDGFRDALVALMGTFAESTEVRAKFKTMHVEVEGDVGKTRMLFEMRGRTGAGWRQITSTWHGEWVLGDPPKLTTVRVSDFREVTPGAKGRLAFEDIAPQVLASEDSYAKQLAQSFDYWRARSDKSLISDLLGRQGVVVGDVNGDELDDLYVLQPGGLPNRLFVHQPDGTARDVSAEAGVDLLDFSRSASLIDLDNDGDRDLVVGFAWKVLFFENDGAGHFSQRAMETTDGQVNSMAAADYDNDGDLDLYVCGQFPSGALKAEQGILGIPMPYYDANNGGPNKMLRNDGGFIFSDVTEAVGMTVNNQRFSLACAWEDYDNDGDQDLYVANDFGRNNFFRNDGGTFTDIAPAAGVEDIGPGMSVAWSDYNHDGLMDLYVANMWSNAGNRITFQKQFLPGASDEIKDQARRHARGNSVYLNDGKGGFRDLTRASGANMARWAWSSNFLDIDNNGREDIVVANGMLTTEDTGDL